MNSIPENLQGLLRVELIHPILSYFPVALLIVGSLLRLLTVFVKKHTLKIFFLFSSGCFLLIGVIFVWLSIFSGETARSIVRASLCRPNVLVQHSYFGYLCAVGYTTVLIFEGFRTWLKFRRPLTQKSLKKTLGVSIIVLTGISFVFICISLALGLHLVFEQGAGVNTKCM